MLYAIAGLGLVAVYWLFAYEAKWATKRALRDNWWTILVLIALAGMTYEFLSYGRVGIPLTD